METDAMNFCKDHSGFKADIENLKKVNGDQWAKMDRQDDRINSIFSRLNITLGSAVVSAILLAINLVYMIVNKH